MKRFNLDEAKDGAQLITRCGMPARLLAYDLERGEVNDCLAVAVEMNGTESLKTYHKDGTYTGVRGHLMDLLIVEAA